MIGLTAKRAFPLVATLAIGLALSACARNNAETDGMNGAGAGYGAGSGPGSIH